MKWWILAAFLTAAQAVTDPTKSEELFQCGTSNQRIPMDWVCNTEEDCDDGSDEVDCFDCAAGQFLCGSGECISQLWKCDSNEDCSDGSDEDNCYVDPTETSCHSYHFTCDNGDCVQASYVCDGEFDCTDQSDERNCTASGNCSEYQFTCENGECIHGNWECDTEADCGDMSDETNCIETDFNCGFGLFNCTIGTCININAVCDNFDDCADGSDEEDCPYGVTECYEHEFRCADSSRGCITREWVCDTVNDCGDFSDETGCEGVCTAYQFECTTGGCANISSRCDGQLDCRDGSDEFVCPYPPPPIECQASQYSCLDGQQCIDPSLVCDGSTHCLDDSDELPSLCQSSERSCSLHNGGCEHSCIEVAGAHVICTCRFGFELASDMVSCNDIDECQYPYLCPQHCVNFEGGYNCTCDPGYISQDIKGCKANKTTPYIILANHANIRRYPLRSHDQATIVVDDLVNCLALDYHYRLGYIFWTDLSQRAIKRAGLDGSHVTTVISQELENPDGIAVDWVNDKLYWSDSGSLHIEVSDLDGSNRAVLVSSGLSAPRAVVVDPEERYLFWTDWGENPRIERSSMDGKSRTVLHDLHIVWPNALTADYVTKSIYWADAKLRLIETSFYDGSGRRPVITEGVRHSFALTMFENTLYWTEWETKSIFSTDKGIGNYVYLVEDGRTELQNVDTIDTDLFNPRDIQVVHPLRQKATPNPCSVGNGGCEYLCLLSAVSPEGYSCACPPGIELADDGRGCKPLNTFLLFAHRVDIRRISLDTNVLVDVKLPLVNLSGAMALDWDESTGQLFWTDIILNTISASGINGSNQHVLLSNNIQTPAGLAVDWLTRKLYWTDDGDTERIEVSDYDGSNRSILVQGNLGNPRDIVVHPTAGIMFWTDWDLYPRIERANLDGTGRVAIVSNDLVYPNGLVIDYEQDRIYWCDGKGRIEFCNFNGENRVSLVNSTFYHPFGLALHGEWLYWTDWESHAVHRTHKDSGEDTIDIVSGLGRPMDIHYFDRNRTSDTVHHPCHDNNGGCSHLCLGRAGEGLEASCACPTGYNLLEDGRNCKEYIDNYLLFPTGSLLQQISLDQEHLANVVLPISQVWAAVSVAVDIVEDHYYWVNKVLSKIFRVPMAGGDAEVFVETNIHTPESIAIDWIGRNLYWADSYFGKIEVVQLSTKSRYVLVQSDLFYVSSLAVDLKANRMFWVDTGNVGLSAPKIEMATMDGSEREVLVSDGLQQPRAIATDNYSGLGAKVCWSDAVKRSIECVNYLGRGRRVVLEFTEETGVSPLGLAIWGEYVYWTDLTTNSLSRALKSDGTQSEVLISNLPTVSDVVIVSKTDLARQETFNHNCDHSSQHCSEICLPNFDTTLFTCVCPTGIKLLGDGVSCESYPDQYLLVAAMTTIQRVSLDFEGQFSTVTLLSGLEGVTALDYLFTAPNEGLVIYGDSNRNALYSAHLNGTGERWITEVGETDGIAVDWVNHNVYWTDVGRRQLGVVSLSTGHRRVLFNNKMVKPRAIALDPAMGLIFWTDWGNFRIENARMDGTGRRVIVSLNINHPNALALNREERRVYWMDAALNDMSSCNYNGQDVTVISRRLHNPFGMALFRGFVFWSNRYPSSIVRGRLEGNRLEREESLLKLSGYDVYSVAVVSAEETREGELDPSGPCAVDNGGCLFLCLPHDSLSRSCLCPDHSPDCQLTLITEAESTDGTPTDTPTTQTTTDELTTTPPTTDTPTTTDGESPTEPIGGGLNFPGTTAELPASQLSSNMVFIMVFAVIIVILLVIIAIGSCVIVKWLRRSRSQPPKPVARLEATNPHYCRSKVGGSVPLTDDNKLNSTKPEKVIGNLLPKKHNNDPRRTPPSPTSANIFRPDKGMVYPVPEPPRRKRPTRLDSCSRPLIASAGSPSPPPSAPPSSSTPLPASSPKQINKSSKPSSKVVRFDASVPAEEQPPPLPARGIPLELGTVPLKPCHANSVTVSIDKPLLVPSPDTTSLESETSC